MVYVVGLDKIAKIASAFNPKFVVINGLPGTGKSKLVSELNSDGNYNVIKFTGSWDSVIAKIDKWIDDVYIILYGCFTNIADLQEHLQNFSYTYMYTYPDSEFKNVIKNYAAHETNIVGTTGADVIKLCKKMYSDSISEFDNKIVVIKT